MTLATHIMDSFKSYIFSPTHFERPPLSIVEYQNGLVDHFFLRPFKQKVVLVWDILL